MDIFLNFASLKYAEIPLPCVRVTIIFILYSYFIHAYIIMSHIIYFISLNKLSNICLVNYVELFLKLI